MFYYIQSSTINKPGCKALTFKVYLTLRFFGILCLGAFTDDFTYDLMNRNKNKAPVTVGGIAEVVSPRETWVKTAPMEMKARIAVDTVFRSSEMRIAILHATS